MDKFFKDLKLIEIASVLAGPAVGMFFAELGASVIKFENAQAGGDITRKWRLPKEPAIGTSAYYASVNYRKEIRLSDLTEPAARAELDLELVDADILITNFRPDVAEKLRLATAELRRDYPKLIIAVIEGYAFPGKPAYDAVLQAETGWIAMNGTGEHLAKLPVALIDELAAHQLKQACLLALLHRDRTGEGSMVRCDLESAALSALANQASNYLMCGAVAKPLGTAHPNIAPYGDLFSSGDGHLFLLAIGSDAQFQKCCDTFALDLFKRAEFSTNTARLSHRESLIETLQGSIGAYSMSEIAVRLESQAIPFGKVKSIDEVMESPAAKALLREEIQDGRKTFRMSGNAFKADFLGDS